MGKGGDIVKKSVISLLSIVGLGLFTAACNADATAQQPTSKASASADPSSSSSPGVILSASGSGDKMTNAFTTTSEWVVTFDFSACAANGQAFSAGVSALGANNGVVSTPQEMNNIHYPKGAGTTPAIASGKYEIVVSASCQWTLTATAATGAPSATPPAGTPAPPSSAAIFTDSGSGGKATKNFIASSEWDLTFDFSACVAAGQAFSAGINSIDSNGGSTSKLSIDTSSNPQGKGTTSDLPAGTYNVSVGADCHWTVTATAS